MWFLTGMLIGHRAGSGPLAARLGLMAAWLLPLPLSALAVANIGPGARAPTVLLGWVAMAAFTLHKPATSSTKLALIDGAVGWARLALIGAVLVALQGLHDARFVISRAEGLPWTIGVALAAVAVEGTLKWWVKRDVVRRAVVFE